MCRSNVPSRSFSTSFCSTSSGPGKMKVAYRKLSRCHINTNANDGQHKRHRTAASHSLAACAFLIFGFGFALARQHNSPAHSFSYVLRGCAATSYQQFTIGYQRHTHALIANQPIANSLFSPSLHPDCHCRHRISPVHARLSTRSWAVNKLGYALCLCYHRSGISPCPEGHIQLQFWISDFEFESRLRSKI